MLATPPTEKSHTPLLDLFSRVRLTFMACATVIADHIGLSMGTERVSALRPLTVPVESAPQRRAG